MKKVCLLFVLFSALCASQNLALAQAPNPSPRYAAAPTAKAEDSAAPTKSNAELTHEVEALRHRVEDLESQNRALVELINAVKAKLEVLPDPAVSDERRPARLQPASAALPRASTPTENVA